MLVDSNRHVAWIAKLSKSANPKIPTFLSANLHLFFGTLIQTAFVVCAFGVMVGFMLCCFNFTRRRDRSPASLLVAVFSVDSGRYKFQTRSAKETEEWMLSFSKVPALLRRLEDYFEVGNVIGEGGTALVRTCISIYTGKQ